MQIPKIPFQISLLTVSRTGLCNMYCHVPRWCGCIPELSLGNQVLPMPASVLWGGHLRTEEMGGGNPILDAYFQNVFNCNIWAVAMRGKVPEQMTPASSWCPQLCSDQPKWAHWPRACSIPVHWRLSKKMSPDPGPK